MLPSPTFRLEGGYRRSRITVTADIIISWPASAGVLEARLLIDMTPLNPLPPSPEPSPAPLLWERVPLWRVFPKKVLVRRRFAGSYPQARERPSQRDLCVITLKGP